MVDNRRRLFTRLQQAVVQEKGQPVFGPDQWPTFVPITTTLGEGHVSRLRLYTVGRALAHGLNAPMLTIGRFYPVAIGHKTV